MTKEKLQEFWKLSNQLRQLDVNDQQYQLLEIEYQNLKSNFVDEIHQMYSNLEEINNENSSEKQSINQINYSLQLLANTCMQASILEEQFLKDQIPEANRKMLQENRKVALNIIASTLNQNIK